MLDEDYYPGYEDEWPDYRIIDAANPTRYLVNMGWAYFSNEDDYNPEVQITALGRSFLRAASRDPEASDASAMVVHIDPRDPIAYARVFEAIESLENVLVVDPHLTPDALFDLVGTRSVSRILTGRGKGLEKRRGVALALRSSRIELRTLENGLHDRWLIPDEGHPMMLGSSFNSIAQRPGVIVPLAEPAAVVAIRSAYEQLWEEARPVEAPTQPGEDVSGSKAPLPRGPAPRTA